MALRLLQDGAFSSDYGAIAVADDVVLSNAHCLIASDNGSLSVTTRDGNTLAVNAPSGITNSFIGAVAFTVSGMAAGATTTATVHLPSGLNQASNGYIRFNYLTNRFEDYTDAQGKPLYTLIDSNSDGQIDAIELTLTDGDERWDRDGIANGSIDDPGFATAADLVISGSQTDDQQQLSFIGKRAFSGTAGELRATHLRLEADLNGDKIAEFAINLRSHVLITSSNLVL